ncbi:MAG: DUF2996 domain-containing protein [Cyanophyceae cyanobacterium]
MAEENSSNAESPKTDDKTAETTAKKQAGTDDSTANKPATKPAAKKPSTKGGKKEKPPAIEDKPFTEFVEQHFVPALKEAFAEQGVEEIDLNFLKQNLPSTVINSDEQCWQVTGNWQNGQRQFILYFLEEDIKGPKAFTYATNGSAPSTIESFMIDERKVNLDLLVLYTLQRLNGQKWLVRN